MKSKKLLALLLALSMLATTVATTSVFAKEADDELVDISSTAVMSTNGNDAFWNVSQVVDGKYATEGNEWATGGNDENGQWKDWYGGLWAAEDGQYIQADFGQAQFIRKIEILGTNPWAWTGAGKVKTIHLSNDPDFATYEEMTCSERVAADNADWAQYVDYKSYWSYSGNTSYRYARVYATPGPYETMTYGGESENPDAFIIHEMIVYAEKMSNELVNVAEGKVVYSSKFGMGSWDGGPNTADTLVDGGKEVYVSPLAAGEEDVITIDLLGDYTVKNVQIDTYGNDDPSNPYYVGEGGGFYVVAKKNLGDAGIELERKMNGDSGYFPVSGGGNVSEFKTDDGEKYRYIEIHYIEGENAVDMRMPEVRVYAPAPEAANSKKLAPVSFGKSVQVGQDPTWGAVTGFTDARKTGDNPHYWLYNAADGQAWVIIDLGCAYPIEMVIPDMQIGEISDVIVSNDANFADENYLIDDNGQWTVEDGEDNMYRFVKIIPTVAPSNASDTTPSTSYWEVVVYSTPEAKEANASLVNIKSTATMSSSLEAGAFDPWPIANANDGNVENIAGVYNATEQSYIQADFGHTQDIKSITVTNANVWGWTGTGKARAIHLSNDPKFTTYEEMVCVQRINEENGESNANSDYVDYKSEWLYAGNSSYRYARIYPTPAAASYTNWGTDTMPSFAIKELDVYATKQSADLVNVIAGKTPTLTSGNWLLETTGANLTDGNNGTVAYASGALAVFELDQHMDIDKVEIDLRADGEVTDADRHYEVYLSNTGTKEGALKILGVEENHQQIGLNTIVLPVDSDSGYKYVLVGSESNFWGLTEVRAMSTGEYAAPDVYGITSALTGEQTKGSVLTLSTSYTLEESINKTVNLYIARYDDNQLTDFVMSFDVIFDGKSGEASLEYTITEDVTVQTQFKGFIWEKATLAPFAPVAEKKN